MSFNEIKCHVNTSLGLVGGCIPCIPPCVRAWSLSQPGPPHILWHINEGRILNGLLWS